VAEVPYRGRARPVADAPVGTLVASADALARDWLVALLAQGPLSAATAVPIADFAREAPGLCVAMARALGSDAELERLAHGDLASRAARAGTLAGAADPVAVAVAVETLRAALWGAALSELRRPEAGLVADLAARLSSVAAVVTAASLRAIGAGAADPAAATAPRPPVAEAAADDDAAPTPPVDAAAASPTRSPRVTADAPEPSGTNGGSGIVSAPDAGSRGRGASSSSASVSWTRSSSAGRAESSSSVPPPAIVRPPTPSDWGAPAARAAEAVEQAAMAQAPPQIVDGPPLEHLSQGIERHLVDGRGLAVLLVELEGVQRLLLAGPGAEQAVAHAEAAVLALMRPGDAAVREEAGRIWITLPGIGPAGARALGLRVAVAVEGAAAHRGAPLTASIGLAVFPADATDAAGLVDRAEESLLLARASGQRGPLPAP
jgi:GGDEF domain-containing protein